MLATIGWTRRSIMFVQWWIKRPNPKKAWNCDLWVSVLVDRGKGDCTNPSGRAILVVSWNVIESRDEIKLTVDFLSSAWNNQFIWPSLSIGRSKEKYSPIISYVISLRLIPMRLVLKTKSLSSTCTMICSATKLVSLVVGVVPLKKTAT